MLSPSPSRSRNRPPSSSPPRGLRETFERIDEEQLLAAEESQEQEDEFSEEELEVSGMAINGNGDHDLENTTVSGLSSIENGTADSFAMKLTTHAREEKAQLLQIKPRERKWGNKGRRDLSWLQRMGGDENDEQRRTAVEEIDEDTKALEDASRRVRQLVGQRKPTNLVRRKTKMPTDGAGGAGLVPEEKKEKLYEAVVKTPASRWARTKNLDLGRTGARWNFGGGDGSLESGEKISEEPRMEKKKESPQRARPNGIPRMVNSPSPIQIERKQQTTSPSKKPERADARRATSPPPKAYDNHSNPYGRARASTNMDKTSKPCPETIPRGRVEKVDSTPGSEDTINLLRSLSRLGSNSRTPSPRIEPSAHEAMKQNSTPSSPPLKDPILSTINNPINEPPSTDQSLLLDMDDSLISMIRRDNILHPTSPTPLPPSLTSRILTSRLLACDSTLDSVADRSPSPAALPALPLTPTRTRSRSPSKLAIEIKPSLSDEVSPTRAPQTPLERARQQEIEEFELTNQKLRSLASSLRETRKGVEGLSRGVEKLPSFVGPPLDVGPPGRDVLDDGRVAWAFWPELYTTREAGGGVEITRFGLLALALVAYFVWFWFYE